MPTGYTSTIADGISPRDFILRCARAMGACVMQRDQPADVLPPKAVEASDYHQKQIDVLVERNSELKQMSLADKEQAAAAEYEKAVMADRQMRIEKAELNSKYDAMLVQVSAWQPPTPDHEGLQKFMIEQIEQSISYDCEIYESEITELSAAEWYSKERDNTLRELGYHVVENHAEMTRAAERTQWLQALWDSLPPESTE